MQTMLCTIFSIHYKNMVPKNIHLLSVQCAAAKVRELAKMAIDKRFFLKDFWGKNHETF